MKTKSVLIADDDFKLTRAIEVRLNRLGLSVMRSPDSLHALLGAHKFQPDLLILDIDMPGGNGLAICEMLITDPNWRKVPVIVYTGHSDEKTRQRCRELGARYVLKSPGSFDDLKTLVCELLDIKADSAEAVPVVEESDLGVEPMVPWNQSATDTVNQTPESQGVSPVVSTPEPATPTKEASRPAFTADDPASAVAASLRNRPKVLCIDDDPKISEAIKVKLECYGVEVVRAFEGMQGYLTALDTKPEVIITDLEMPDGNGNYILGRLKVNPLTKSIPVIVLTGETNPGVKRDMYAMGAAAYFTKPMVFEELLQELQRHIALPSKPVAKQVAARR